MAEASEAAKASGKIRRKRQSLERKFARSRGLVPANTPIGASRSDWAAAAKRAPIQRISGQDVARAKGDVNRARKAVAKSGFTYYNKPAGGTKPSGRRLGALQAAKTRATGMNVAQRNEAKAARLGTIPKYRRK